MNAEKYRLVGRKSTSATWKVFEPQTDNFRTFTSGLQSNTCYQWSVKAKCDGVWTAWQEIREFCTSSGNKNETYNEAEDPFVNQNEFFVSDIQVYPNPTNDYVNLSFISAKETDVQIVLSDILGKVVFTKKYNCKIGEEAARFQVSDLPQGTYFLQVIDENEILGVQKVSVF
jgi:hypothetical protein